MSTLWMSLVHIEYHWDILGCHWYIWDDNANYAGNTSLTHPELCPCNLFSISRLFCFCFSYTCFCFLWDSIALRSDGFAANLRTVFWYLSHDFHSHSFCSLMYLPAILNLHVCCITASTDESVHMCCVETEVLPVHLYFQMTEMTVVVGL